MDPRPLPPVLRGEAFTILGGTVGGVSKSRMLRDDLARPTYGVRRDGPPSTLTELATATALALPPDVAFSHATAAGLLNLPLPSEVGAPLHVMRTSGRNRIRRAGCVGHLGLERRELLIQSGLTLVSPADTWADLADLPLDDLVVLGDAIASRGASTDPLVKAVARRGRVPHRSRSALSLVRVGSASPMESRSRLVFIRAGLPEPELNAAVTDDGDEWIATGDFVWRRRRVMAEYQGEYHFADFDQGDRDITRRLLAQDHDWRYVEITKRDIFETVRRRAMIQRLRRLLMD
ncbi:MAG: hypothetical protein M3Y71_14090 [Actinomycetota bacterium]|nr:hypothetical protein [Actinomycetota bacterium]